MPHSSGGGSHGGGSHGGSHGRGSGNHVSHHYFPGARRYRRHRHGYDDEYVYARSKPQKVGIFTVILVLAFSGFAGFGTCTALGDKIPHKLDPVYTSPAAHVEDKIDVFADDEKLEQALEQFEEVSGICPVVYTVYNEDWINEYADLESYTYSMYVDNYPDEQHFVIVYSIPEDQAEAFASGELDVPDYAWEAVQGDETDPILTEGTFRHFARRLQDRLEEGEDPGKAIAESFEDITGSIDGTLNFRSPLNVISMVFNVMPLIIALLIMGFASVIVIRQFIKDRNTEYEEVPLDVDPQQSVYTGTGTGAAGQAIDPAAKIVMGPAKNLIIAIVAALIAVFMLPFVLVGLLPLVAGIAAGDVFVSVFGLIWLMATGAGFVIPLVLFIKFIRKYRQERREAEGNYDETRYEEDRPDPYEDDDF